MAGKLPEWREIAEMARKTPGVTSATPLIEQPLMATYTGRVEGVLVRGMRIEDIRSNKTLALKAGSMAEVTPGSGNVAIGARLAEQLGATVGSQISLISPDGQTTPFGSVPRVVGYRVAAIFEIGIYDYDKAFVIMPIADAQQLLLLGDSVGMVELETTDADNVGTILKPLVTQIGDRAVVTDWRGLNSALFEALAVERVAMFVVLSIIVLVAVFNILSSLIMLVAGKDARHCDPADDGCDAQLARAHLRRGRHGDRCDRYCGWVVARFRLPVLSAEYRRFRAVRDGAEPLGSVDPLPYRIAVEDRSGGDRRHHGHGAAVQLPGDALSRDESGGDRSGASAPL